MSILIKYKLQLLCVFIGITQTINAQYNFEQIDVWSGSNGGSAKFLTEYNGELYFQAAELTPSFRKLYKTNGTMSGALQVATNLNGGAGYSPESLTVFNGELYFTAQVSGLGIELYKTNGTEMGTVLIKDIRTGGSNGLDQNSNNDKQLFIEYNGELYFRGSTNSSIELWKTDGTETGTVSVQNFEGTQTGAPAYVSNNDIEYLGVVFNNELFFSVNRSGTFELWKSDGTTAGTELVKGSFTDPINNLIVFDNTLFFTTAENATGNEIWSSDGTTSGTQIQHDIFPNNLNPALGLGSSPSDFFIFDNSLFFSARGYDDLNNTIIGRELYKSDGTNWELVKNINITDSGSSVEGSGLNSPKFKAFQNELLFIANDDNDGQYGLWKTDGTESGTVELISEFDTAESFQFRKAIEYNGNLFYFNFQDLWVTDGTLSGTEELTDITGANSTILLAQTGELIMFDNKLWFDGLSNANGSELTSLTDTTLSQNGTSFSGSKVKLYPNPVSHELHIDSNFDFDSITVYSLLGHVLLTSSESKINVAHLNAGQYIIKIKSYDQIKTLKFIKY